MSYLKKKGDRSVVLPGSYQQAMLDMQEIVNITIESPACAFAYKNSSGRNVNLSFETLENRLYNMSFDPYHCPELRWGAPQNSREMSTCKDGRVKLDWYIKEGDLEILLTETCQDLPL